MNMVALFSQFDLALTIGIVLIHCMAALANLSNSDVVVINRIHLWILLSIETWILHLLIPPSSVRSVGEEGFLKHHNCLTAILISDGLTIAKVLRVLVMDDVIEDFISAHRPWKIGVPVHILNGKTDPNGGKLWERDDGLSATDTDPMRPVIVTHWGSQHNSTKVGCAIFLASTFEHKFHGSSPP
jgi:hypothetical protein